MGVSFCFGSNESPLCVYAGLPRRNEGEPVRVAVGGGEGGESATFDATRPCGTGLTRHDGGEFGEWRRTSPSEAPVDPLHKVAPWPAALPLRPAATVKPCGLHLNYANPRGAKFSPTGGTPHLNYANPRRAEFNTTGKRAKSATSHTADFQREQPDRQRKLPDPSRFTSAGLRRNSQTQPWFSTSWGSFA
jgi:hypothetical protein